jgi:hypothetical protein
MSSVAKTYNINITLQMKRSKEEVEVARGELERLHGYIEKGTELPWAKKRIEDVTTLLLLPNPDQIKSAIRAKLEDEDTDISDATDFKE